MDLHLWRGQGSLRVDKTAFQSNPTAGRHHLSPSICSHRAFLSGILDSSSGCLFERTACRSISQQQDKPHAHGSGKLFQTDNPGISVQLAARWAGTAWHFCICQGGRREARASGTRSDKPNHPPAS